MTIDLHRIAIGLAIEDDDGTARGHILSGTGAPGGDAGTEDDAPIGSIYLRTDASASISAVYQKITDTNAVADWVQSASKDYVDSIVNGLSWREPALTHETTLRADVTAAEVAANVGDTVDGVTIAATDRILLSNLTAGNENIYIVSGSTGSWNFTEDTNLATDGDALLIQEGTSAEQQWVYDGSAWVQIASTTGFAELAFIRTFIGKTAAGSETPTYSSTNIVSSATSLETAIGALDAAIGDRTYTEDNYVTDSETITASIDALDIAINANSIGRATSTTVTTATTVDTVLVDEHQAVKWLVAIFDEADTDQKYATEVFAVHDGTASSDATVIEWNETGRLRINGSIIGLDIDVVISGTGAAQTMGIQITSTDTVTVHTTRIDVEI